MHINICIYPLSTDEAFRLLFSSLQSSPYTSKQSVSVSFREPEGDILKPLHSGAIHIEIILTQKD